MINYFIHSDFYVNSGFYLFLRLTVRLRNEKQSHSGDNSIKYYCRWSRAHALLGGGSGKKLLLTKTITSMSEYQGGGGR